MSWMTRLPTTRVRLAMLLALTVCAAGCQREPAAEGRAGEDFLRDDETSAVTRIVDRQAAVGARTDATLRPYHFDHAGLNALGREKLDQVLAAGRDRDGQGGELVVYLDLAGDDANTQHADARRADVTDYLAAQGLSGERFRLESGFNPHNTMSAAAAAPTDGADAAAEGGEAEGAAGGFGPLTDMVPTK